MHEPRTTVYPRLDTGFEAALDGDRGGLQRALVHAPLIELVDGISTRIQEMPATSQAEVLGLLIPAVSAWAQLERGWMVFDRLPSEKVELGVAAAEFLGPASQGDNPVLASFACQVLAGYLAGQDVEELRLGFLNRAVVERHEPVSLDALEPAPARGEGAVSWMIEVVGRYPDATPAVLADAYEARFDASSKYSQPIELLRLFGYGDIWRDTRAGFLADCLRMALRLGEAVNSTGRDDLHLSPKVAPHLPHVLRDEIFATDVLHAVSHRLTFMLTADRALRMPQTMDRYLLLARLSNVLRSGAMEQRTKSVCVATLAQAEPHADRLNREVYAAIDKLKTYHQDVGRRARRKYLTLLVGWIPVTVVWSYVAASYPTGAQHFLWPVFIWLSTRTLRSLAKFRTVLSIWPSVAVSLLCVAGYIAGRALVGRTRFDSSLLTHLTLGTVLAVTAGFLVALVSIAFPQRGAQAVIQTLPEGLPEDWQDAAEEELARS